MTTNTGYWVNYLDPKLIHLWGNMGVSYYGLSYVLAFVLGVCIHRLMISRRRSPFGREEEEVLLYALVLGVLVGARVGYCVLYALPELIARPFFLFEVWHGGMSFTADCLALSSLAFGLHEKRKCPFSRLGILSRLSRPWGFFWCG